MYRCKVINAVVPLHWTPSYVNQHSLLPAIQNNSLKTIALEMTHWLVCVLVEEKQPHEQPTQRLQHTGTLRYGQFRINYRLTLYTTITCTVALEFLDFWLAAQAFSVR